MIENWCKRYIFKWLHVEREPPEGWVKYCLYKLYWRWRRPDVAIKGFLQGVKATYVVEKKEIVPVSSLKFTHPVTNDITDLKLKKRIEKLQQVPAKALFTQDDVNLLMPSINNVRVLVHNNEHKVCDGNGRIFALQQTHPEASVEVDIIKVDKMPPKKKKEPNIGDLRIKKKLALVPTECEGNDSCIGFYYSLEQYISDYCSYNPIRKWSVKRKIADGHVNVTNLLVDPDLTNRKFGQMLYKIIREGDVSLLSPEEIE